MIELCLDIFVEPKNELSVSTVKIDKITGKCETLQFDIYNSYEQIMRRYYLERFDKVFVYAPAEWIDEHLRKFVKDPSIEID